MCMDNSMDDTGIFKTKKKDIRMLGSELVQALVSTKENVQGINAETKDHLVQDWNKLMAQK